MLVLDVGASNPTDTNDANKQTFFIKSRIPHMKLVCGCGGTSLLNLDTREVYMKSNKSYIYNGNVYNKDHIQTLTDLEVAALQANPQMSLLQIKIDEFKKNKTAIIDRQRNVLRLRSFEIKRKTKQLYQERTDKKNNSLMFKLTTYLGVFNKPKYQNQYIEFPCDVWTYI